MGELLALDPRHRSAVTKAHGGAPEQRYSMSFSRVLGDWFRGRFKAVVAGIGVDLREGEGLAERDALTTSKTPKGGGGG